MISVLLPTLGSRQKDIVRLLNSLDGQTFKKFEIIIAVQENHNLIKNIVKNYGDLNIVQIDLNRKGLSYARNEGLKKCRGNIIILSDDDCWYPNYALEEIDKYFETSNASILLTQIFDKNSNQLYKNYPKDNMIIKNKLELMSKSSIEIAFRRNNIKELYFDENFGLGSNFVCGEEVDFLLRNFNTSIIHYVPLITVYHPKKYSNSSNQQIVAKGALYKKNYNFIICLLVLLRDLFIKKENNFHYFYKGYKEQLKIEESNK